MFAAKIFISVLILIISFLNFNYKKPIQEESSRFYPDSLKVQVNSEGWNHSSLKIFEHFLINSELPENKLKDALKEFQNNFEKKYLYSLILKREKKFREMYDSLIVNFNNKISYLSYYDELVFSAKGTNQLSILESKLETDKSLPALNKNYLAALIKTARGEHTAAKDFLYNCLKEDSLNKKVIYHLSYAFRNLGDYDKALNILNDAIDIFSNDNFFLTEAILAEGSLYFLSGENANAKIQYKKSLDLARKTGDRQNEAKALVNLGIISDIEGDIESARENFKKAEEISEKISDHETKALALSESGVSYSFTNNLIKAKEKYAESYEIYKSLGNKLRLSLLSDNLGKIYLTLFNYKQAIKYYTEGLDFAGENKRAQVLNLLGLADSYANLSNYSKALHYYNEARKLSSEIKDISLGAEVTSGLGSLSYNLGRFGSALEHYSSAQKFSEENNNPFFTADVYHKLGLVHSQIDSLKVAKDFLLKSINLSKEYSDKYTEGLALNDLAYVFMEEKEFVKAADALNKADKAATTTGWLYLAAKNELLRGELNKLRNNFESASASYKRAITLGKELNEFNIQIEGYYLLGKLFSDNNLNEAAESYFNSAVNIIEDVSRPLFIESEIQISYLSAQNEVYRSLADLYLEQKKYNKAYQMIDRFSSRNMMQNISNLKLLSSIKNDSLLNRIYEYEWLIHSGIEDEAATDSILNEYKIFKKGLTAKNKRLEHYLDGKKTPALEEMQKKLDEDENIVSVYSTDTKTFIFHLNKSGFKTITADLNKQDLSNYLKSVSPYFDKEKSENTFFNQDLFSFNAKSSNEFYKKLLESVIKNIPEEEKIIFTSSEELISFPFEFLVTNFGGDESPYNYKGKNFLINNYNISYSPSPSAYIEQKENSLENSGGILLVGNPSIDTKLEGFAERRNLIEESGGLPRNIALLPLRYSEEEVIEVDDIVNADNVLTENEATESNFKQFAEMKRVIHLSTHSFLFNKQPLIFFSNFYDPENDGFLEAAEIVQLKLNSDLVVLSSCNSGLGAVDKAEGILGMTKAFYEAGSKSVVVSLWEVNDKFTSRLMKLFYEKLDDGYGKSEALRRAKIEFINEYSPNPYYWGAFVLSGNLATISFKSKVSVFPYLAGIFIVIISASLVILLRRYWIKKAPIKSL